MRSHERSVCALTLERRVRVKSFCRDGDVRLTFHRAKSQSSIAAPAFHLEAGGLPKLASHPRVVISVTCPSVDESAQYVGTYV